MQKRQRIGNRYISRRKNGTISKNVNVGRSLSADRRTKAKKTVKAGYGDKGDVKRAETLVVGRKEYSGKYNDSGDFKIEEEGTDNQYIGEWNRFWRDSQNYVVYTKTMERNPNKYKTPEKLPWDGYCE